MVVQLYVDRLSKLCNKYCHSVHFFDNFKRLLINILSYQRYSKKFVLYMYM